jgi:hypothetical protein
MVGPKLVFGHMAAPVPEIINGSMYLSKSKYYGTPEHTMLSIYLLIQLS